MEIPEVYLVYAEPAQAAIQSLSDVFWGAVNGRALGGIRLPNETELRGKEDFVTFARELEPSSWE